MKLKQVAALPVKRTKKGKIRILLVTSRETRRWVVPKGWPMDGKKPWRAAEIEAMEEAGAEGEIAKSRIGTFDYHKRFDNGDRRKCRVSLFPLHVENLRRKYRERDQRTRKWFSPRAAARVVDEKDLKKLFRSLRKDPEILLL